MLYIILAAILTAAAILDTTRGALDHSHPAQPYQGTRSTARRATSRRPARRNPYQYRPYRQRPTPADLEQRRRPGHPIATRGPRPDLYRRQ